MTGKFNLHIQTHNNSAPESQQELKKIEKKILEKIVKPSLSEVLSVGNEMDKDIEINEGKKFKHFNRAEKTVYNSDDDSTNDSALDFSIEKIELSRTYESHTSDRFIDTKSSIELSKDKISITSKESLSGAPGNIQSGSGGSTMTLDVTSQEIKVTLDVNDVYGLENGKKEILKVDSKGVKTEKISQTVYNEPTDEKDYVTKRYVDKAVQNAGGGSKNVQWNDIKDRPNSIVPYTHSYNGTIEYRIENIGNIMTVDPNYFSQKIKDLEQQIKKIQQH